MSDPTPFSTDPLEPEGVDPDLAADDSADESAERGNPDDREPSFDEQQHDRAAAEQQGQGEHYTDIA